MTSQTRKLMTSQLELLLFPYIRNVAKEEYMIGLD